HGKSPPFLALLVTRNLSRADRPRHPPEDRIRSSILGCIRPLRCIRPCDAYALAMHTPLGCIRPRDAYAVAMHTPPRCIRTRDAYAPAMHTPSRCIRGGAPDQAWRLT